MSLVQVTGRDRVLEITERRRGKFAEAEAVVRPIIDDVEKRGDAALHEYAMRFDGFAGKCFCADRRALADAAARLTPAFRDAVAKAAANVRAFAEWQLARDGSFEILPGIIVGQIVRPLQTVAAYIPSGTYPLPSTLIMTAVPAQVAGVPEICVTSPRAVEEIDGVAHLLGIERVFRLGGAHAIAAFAFGTETVPKADRIVGPGNVYVAAAKKLLAGQAGIEFVAGPTEVLIIADDADPRFVAADMLAQAEHDAEASAIFLTSNRLLAEEVASELESQLNELADRATPAIALRDNGAIAVISSLAEAVELANRCAPEHLSIYDESLLPSVVNAGSVFVGPFSPEAAGDYAAGPNHVLPTGGASRIRGGLSVNDFVKVISVQRLTCEGLASIGDTVTTLARAENLEAHARSVEVRRC